MFVNSESVLLGAGRSIKAPLPVYLLALLVVWFFLSLAPDGLPMVNDLYNSKRLLQSFLLCILSLCLLFKNFRKIVCESVASSSVFCLLASLLLLLLLGSLLSTHPLHSLFEALHYFLLFSVFATGLYLSRTELANFLLIFLVCCYSFLLLRASLSFTFELAMGTMRPSIFYPSVISVRFFNQIQLFFIPLLAVFLCHRKYARISVILLFVSLLLAIAGGARGLIVSLICTGIFCASFFKMLRRPLLRAAFVFIAAVVCYELLRLTIITGDPAGQVSPFRFHTSGRSAIWSELLSALTPWHLFLGSGTGAYAFTDFWRIEGHPHNSLLQFLFEWGALATSIFVGLIAVVFFRGWNFFKEAQREGDSVDFEAALFVTLLSAGIYSLFSGIVVMPIPQTLLFLYLGIFWARVHGHLAEVKISLPPPLSILARIILVASLVFYVSAVGDYFLQQETAAELRGPRFWGNGAPMQ